MPKLRDKEPHLRSDASMLPGETAGIAGLEAVQEKSAEILASADERDSDCADDRSAKTAITYERQAVGGWTDDMLEEYGAMFAGLDW